MCILCVASRWSRRIVTMLPWLIIPLIILWALSQLLPPGFRFEVTSPRLACVGVLLISLGWYELAMPRLSMWRAKRSALLRERRRIEAQEAAKWRREATRRCRNCFSAYRDQTPGGGKFMCTFCGHISKRPVLEVPGLPDGLSPGGPIPGIQSSNGTGSAGGFPGSRSSRGWGGRGWPDRGGWVPGGRGSWVPSSWSGRSWASTSAAYWGRGASGGGWGGSSYGGSLFGSEGCVAGDPHQGGLLFLLFQSLSVLFLCLKWVWRRLWKGERLGEDGGLNGGRRGGQRKGEDGGIPQGNRGDKARRKAEEKRQARLEREQLEAEERRQREEVARLVEERRRLRDEKLEAEKESEREAAAERERELRREREAERRRQEKVKEKEKELAKEKSRDTDSEDSRKKKEKKDMEKKTDSEKRGETEKKGSPVQNGDPKKAMKGSRGAGVDLGHKAADAGAKIGSGAGGKVGSSRFVGPVKGVSSVPPKNGGGHQNNTSSFWGKGLTGTKSAKGPAPAGSTPAATAGSGTKELPNGKPTESSYSSWNRMPWGKVWGKSTTSAPEVNVAPQIGTLHGNARMDLINQNGVKPSMNGLSGSGVSDLSQSTAEVKQPTGAATQTRSWPRLFSNSNSNVASLPPPSDNDSHQEHQQNEGTVIAPNDRKGVPLQPESTLFFGHGLQGSPIPKPALVSPVGPPVHVPALSFVSNSPPSMTTNMSTSVFTPVHGTSTVSTFTLPSPLVPNPIGKPVHPPVSSPLHTPASKTSRVPQDQLPHCLDPWLQPSLSLDEPADVPVGDKWQMWESPQLSEHGSSWNYLSSKDRPRPPPQSLEPENQIPATLFSPHQLVGPGCIGGEVLSPLPLSNRQSLWSGHSYGQVPESGKRIWGEPDLHHRIPSEFADCTDDATHQRVPPEFVDCITQEVMMEPVITADGHSYERSAIEKWLMTHDTSPITGEVLPAPPGGYGSGVDKTLRPNHILRGQIIEYKESMARMLGGTMQESNRDKSWSPGVGLGLGGSGWPERPPIAGYYTTPGAHSLWSYNGSQNPQNSLLSPYEIIL